MSARRGKAAASTAKTPGPGSRLHASEKERAALIVLASTSCEGFADGAATFEPALARFDASIVPARRQHERALQQLAATGFAVPPAVRNVLAAVVISMACLAALVAGTIVLPPRESAYVASDLALTVSTIAAVVATLAALVCCVLPAWGSKETRAQLWKLLAFAAVLPPVGLVVALARSTHTDPSVEPWLSVTWVTVNISATAVLVLAAYVHWKRRIVDEAPAEPDPDVRYFNAILPAKAGALVELDRTAERERRAAMAATAAWADGLSSARTSGHVTARTAAWAASVTPWRILLEIRTEPEFIPRSALDG